MAWRIKWSSGTRVWGWERKCRVGEEDVRLVFGDSCDAEQGCRPRHAPAARACRSSGWNVRQENTRLLPRNCVREPCMALPSDFAFCTLHSIMSDRCRNALTCGSDPCDKDGHGMRCIPHSPRCSPPPRELKIHRVSGLQGSWLGMKDGL
eukprot:1218298-Rhodomonas_salina.2